MNLNRKEALLMLTTALVTAGVMTFAQNQKSVMGSSVVEWKNVEAKPTKTGSYRKFFQAPTATLDELECHVTSLNPGQMPHPPHQHPDEELIIIKEGTVDALVNGEWKRVGPGSTIFQAANVPHALSNCTDSVVTYHVIKWTSPGMLKEKGGA
jgi:quercetin dioxygenase-like cupin family protein